MVDKESYPIPLMLRMGQPNQRSVGLAKLGRLPDGTVTIDALIQDEAFEAYLTQGDVLGLSFNAMIDRSNVKKDEDDDEDA